MTDSTIEAVQPDDLGAFLEREVILAYSEQGGGKSSAIVKLIEQGEQEGFNVVCVDRDRGLAKAIREVFGGRIPENVDYYLADKWDKIPAAVSHAFDVLEAGDWFCSDMLGRFWDFAQTEYSRRVYGEEVSAHLLTLRADAQKVIDAAGQSLRATNKKDRDAAQAEVARAMQYSGMEGRTDWSIVKRMHNDDVFDRLILSGSFNILSTSSAKDVSDDEAKRNMWEMFHGLMKRPEGEKHQVYRHDTIAYLYKRGSEFMWRTDLGAKRGKDRGRNLYKDIWFGDVGDPQGSPGFVKSYMDWIANPVADEDDE